MNKVTRGSGLVNVLSSAQPSILTHSCVRTKTRRLRTENQLLLYLGLSKPHATALESEQWELLVRPSVWMGFSSFAVLPGQKSCIGLQETCCMSVIAALAFGALSLKHAIKDLDPLIGWLPRRTRAGPQETGTAAKVNPGLPSVWGFGKTGNRRAGTACCCGVAQATRP